MGLLLLSSLENKRRKRKFLFVLYFVWQGVDVEHITNTNHPGMLIGKSINFMIPFLQCYINNSLL